MPFEQHFDYDSLKIILTGYLFGTLDGRNIDAGVILFALRLLGETVISRCRQVAKMII
jgi:hypothetical protein